MAGGGATSSSGHPTGTPIQSFAASVAASPRQSIRTPLYPDSRSISELDRYWEARREAVAAKARANARRSPTFPREQRELVPPNRTTASAALGSSLHSTRRLSGSRRRDESAPSEQAGRPREPWPGFWSKRGHQKEAEEEEVIIVIDDSDDEDLEQQSLAAAPRDSWQQSRAAHLAESTHSSSLRRDPYDTDSRDPRLHPPERRTLDTAAAQQRSAEGERREGRRREERRAYSLRAESPPDPADRLLESLRSKRDMRQQQQQHSLMEEEVGAADVGSFWRHRYPEMQRRSLSLRTEDISPRPSPSSEMPLRHPSSPQDNGRSWSNSSPPLDHTSSRHQHQQPGVGASSSWFASLLPKPISSLLLPSPAQGPPRSNLLATSRHLSPPRSSSSRGVRPEGRSHPRREEVVEEPEEEEETDLSPHHPLPRPSWLSATKRPQPRRLSDDALRRQQKQQQQPVFSKRSSPTEPSQWQQQQQRQQHPLSPPQPSSRLLPSSSPLQLLPSSASPPAQTAHNGAYAATTTIVCRKTPHGSLRKRPASRKQEAPVRIVRAGPGGAAAAPAPALREPQPPSDQEDSDPQEQHPRSAASLSPDDASMHSSEPFDQGGQQLQRRRRQGMGPQSKAARWEEQVETRAPLPSSSTSLPSKAGRRGRKNQQPKRTPAKGTKEAPQKQQKQGTKRKQSEALPKTSGGSKAAGGGEEGKNSKRQYRPCVCMKGKAVYGILGEDREDALWCVACPSRPPHAVDVYRKRCSCGISQPSFALPGTLLKDAKWCSLCPGKPDAAVNVRSKRCECGRSQPSFGPPTGGKLGNARWCKVCPNKPPNAPNFRIRSKFEIHQKRRLNLASGIRTAVGRPRGTKNSTPAGAHGDRRGPGRPAGSGGGGRGAGRPSSAGAGGRGPGRPSSSAGGRGPGRPPGPASFTARMAALRRKQQQQEMQKQKEQEPVLRFPEHLKRVRQLPLLRSGWGMDTVERRLRQRVAEDGFPGGLSAALLRSPADSNSPSKKQKQQSQSSGSWAPSLAVLRAQQEQSDPDNF